MLRAFLLTDTERPGTMFIKPVVEAGIAFDADSSMGRILGGKRRAFEQPKILAATWPSGTVALAFLLFGERKIIGFSANNERLRYTNASELKKISDDDGLPNTAKAFLAFVRALSDDRTFLLVG